MNRLSGVLLAGLAGLCGCLEHQVQTTVREDGTCDRVVMVPADSMEIPATPFPLPAGAGWDTAWRPAREGKGLVLTLSKHFDRYEDLAAEYAPPADSARLHVEVLVERSFRWFYTYYRYRETFHRLTPFTRVPPSTILSEEEITRYARGERNTVLNQKVEIWVARSLYEILYDSLNTVLAAEGAQRVAADLERAKDSLFVSMVAIGADSTLRDFGEVMGERIGSREDPRTFFVGSKISDAGLAAFLRLVELTAGIPPQPALERAARAGWQAWNAAVERSARMQGVFVFSVALPGLVVETNSPIAEEGILTWKFDGEQYSMTDFVMAAESRVENLWAFGVTITVALVLGGIILVGRRNMGA